MSAPLRLAVPNKGRLSEPAVELLRNAGLDFELSERRLSAAVRNADIELLFVRTEDVAEYVADGLVDLGLTGADLVAEHGGDLSTILNLGFGACSLVLAVPRDAEIHAPADLAGRRIATSFPRVTGSYLAAAGVTALVVEVRGAVEVTPQLGVADAVVDLVASGGTLRMNGLRPVATLLASEAVLVGRNGIADEDGRVRDLVAMLRSVLDARGREYMMMNAPADSLDRIRALIPGLSGPTVMPLADPSFIAVHSVVERSQLWRIVPAL
ncbi:MAG: ATP phosphoribosyltransferase, partial [Candidatus Limnocylindria bacterium]